MSEIQTQPDDTPDIRRSDIQGSWAGFGGQLGARADLFGMSAGLHHTFEYGQAAGALPPVEAPYMGELTQSQAPAAPPLAATEIEDRLKREGLTGHIPHPSPNSRVLDLQIAHEHEERDREVAIARGPQGFVPDALGLITSLGAGMIDPVNAAAFMFPVGGEAFWGARLAARETMAGRFGVKAVQGGLQGAAGGTALLPAEWWLKTQDGQDFTMADALKSVVMTAGMGAGFHAGFGSVGDLLRRARGLPYKGSTEDLQMRAIGGDTRAAEVLERMGRGATRPVPGEGTPEEVPGITAAEHPLPEPPAAGSEDIHPARRVFDDAREQLIAAGMSREAAGYNAAVVAARYDTRAGRLNDGRDAYELYKSEGLTIRRPNETEEVEGRAFAQSARGIPVDTPEFKTWSYGAPIVKSGEALTHPFETGTPVVVEAFHGTNADFEAFDPAKRGEATAAASAHMGDFSASEPAVASSFADTTNPYREGLVGKLNKATGNRYELFNEAVLRLLGRKSGMPQGANVKPIYVRMGDPLVVDFKGHPYRERTYAEIIAGAKAKGHDGVILKNTIDEGFTEGGDRPTNVYVSFEPENIKSAFNRGTWDPSDTRMLFQAARPTEPGLFAEREAEGQQVIPGGERISDAALAQRRADQALKPKVAQKPMDIGLFGDDSKQKTLFQSEDAEEIHSFDDIRALLKKHEKLFVRWSASQSHDMTPGARSRDYQSGEHHTGLSAQAIEPDFSDDQIFRFLRDYGYLRSKGNEGAKPRLYTGDVVGKDTDGADSIAPRKYLGTLSDELVRFLDDDTNRQRMSLADDLETGRKALARYAKEPPKYIPIWTPERVAEIEARLAEMGGPVQMPQRRTFFQSEQRAPTFYSATERSIAASKQEKASPEQWLATIKNTPGVKGEEMEWLGLADWLKEQKGSISKQAIADYVRANAIEVKEITKGAGLATFDPSKLEIKRTRRSTTQGDVQLFYDGQAVGQFSDEFDHRNNYEGLPDAVWAGYAQRELARREGAAPKYNIGQAAPLPGGENYRELLLTLPERPGERGPRGWGDTAGGTADTGNFRSSHWDEPNVLAHIRFDDRIIDGKKTLHVAEFQSDWHQKGRREGYRGSSALTPLTEAERHELVGLRIMGSDVQRDPATYDRYSELQERFAAHESAVPDAPFKTTWPELSLKRMIRYAAENGYDRLSWDSGETNAERYDLSKQIERLNWSKNSDGTFDLTAWQHGTRGPGSAINVGRNIPAEQLGDHIGKDVAEKIRAGEGREPIGTATLQAAGRDMGNLSGLDLKVGGEGMRGFYDKILPAAASKLVKKFGAKVESANLEHAQPEAGHWFIDRRGADEAGRPQYAVQHTGGETEDIFPSLQDAMGLRDRLNEHARHEGASSIHVLAITPQLRDAAIRNGFPLFQSGEGAPRGRITLGENRAVIDLFAKADRSTFMHESAHLWLEEMIRDGSGENAPQGLKDDLKAILDWLGVAKPDDITTAHHEQWARAFEQYLAEGKAPSSRLAQAFEKFKEWLLSIYHSLASLDAPLSDDVRGVMDRMLASDAEIAEARAAPPHPAEALADLPPRAREDALRAATADVIAGRPVRAGEMLAEAAKEDPRIAESLSPFSDYVLAHPDQPLHISALQFGAEEAKRAREASNIDATHDVVSGANSSKDPNGPVYIDHRIPRLSPKLMDRAGQPADLWKYLSTHERDEAARMARGEPYDAAHQGATQTERAAVEADGVDWTAYTHEIDGYLATIEHEKAENPPPPNSTHIDPQAAIGHHRSENKQANPETGTSPENGTRPRPAPSRLTIALPTVARSMIDDAEAYKLAAMKRRERTGGSSAVTMHPSAEARDRARGISPQEGRERHAAAEKAFDVMVAEQGIEGLPEDVRTLAIEAVRDRGMDPETAFDYASAKAEREAIEHEDFLSTLKGEDLDGLDAARHVIASEDGGHDLHGEIPFGPGGAAAEGGRQDPGQAGVAAEHGEGPRPGRQGAQQAVAGPGKTPGRSVADWRKFADVAHPAEDPDIASASLAAEKTKDPESTEPAKAVTAAQKAAGEADKLLADILPGLSDEERAVFENALNALDVDRAQREQIVQEGAACLAAAVA